MMGQQELAKVVRELKELKLYRDEVDAEIEAKEDAIKAEMTARDVDAMTVDVFKVTWKAVTSARFDTSAFKAAHRDVYDLFAKQSETRRFCIA